VGERAKAPGTWGAEETAFRRILADHATRYPALEIQDLYKLVHQAAMGGEHAVGDVAAARRWLERELSSLGDGPAEPVADILSPDGRIARVHLRPYVAAGGDPLALLAAFIRTAHEHKGAQSRLRRYWAWAERMAQAGELPLSESALAHFFARKEREGFPAAHHSAAYAAAYRPAYRVIVRTFLDWP
jgi:hypothetical protein